MVKLIVTVATLIAAIPIVAAAQSLENVDSRDRGHGPPPSGRTNVAIGAFVYNYAEVPVHVLDGAKSVVSHIYDAIGVEIVWLDGRNQPLTDAPTLRSMISVHLLSREMAARLDAPKSMIGKAVSGGRVVTVLYHRLARVSRSYHPDIGSVLGHVVAHEVGHVLLPPNAHSKSGIMRPDLNVPLVANGMLFFTSDQGKAIHGRVVGAPAAALASR